MNELMRLLRESAEVQAVAGLGLLVLLWAVWQAVANVRLRRRFAAFLRGSDGASLEEALRQSVAELDDHSRRLAEANDRLDRLEAKVASAIRFVGVQRYDAFGGQGGQQSFALALYDEEGNGAVVTSQVGRQECRVFCKELQRGKSEWPLAEEEGQAIEAAAGKRARARAGR